MPRSECPRCGTQLCYHCGGLVPTGSGRPRVYCSEVCRRTDHSMMYQTLKLLGFTNREATNCRSRPKYEKLLKEKYGAPPKKRTPRKPSEAGVGYPAATEHAGHSDPT